MSKQIFENEVECLMCGYKHATTIQNHIRWQHPETNVKEYKEKYNAEITSEVLKRRRAEKSSKANKGRVQTEEEKLNRSIKNKAHWEGNVEAKKKVADRIHQLALEGNHPKQTVEGREQARQHCIKMNKTKKHAKRVSEALKGHKDSDETRKKKSIGHIGIKHTEKSKNKISETRREGFRSGRLKPTENKKLGLKGMYFSTKENKEIYYDSKLELAYYKILDNDLSVVTWERCKDKIPYQLDDGWRMYYPDVLVNGNEIHEVKAKWFWVKNKVVNNKKLLAAKEYCEEKGWKYKVIFEDEIGIDYGMPDIIKDYDFASVNL